MEKPLYSPTRAELGAPFAREEELAEKTARLNELNVLLKVDKKDKTLIAFIIQHFFEKVHLGM